MFLEERPYGRIESALRQAGFHGIEVIEPNVLQAWSGDDLTVVVHIHGR
jgi:hypothetical protein